MYYFKQFCCICMNKSDLKPLFEVDIDGLSYYDKLISSIVEMNFKEMNDQRLICGECCITLNTVHNFRLMCLRSKTNFITYISQLPTSDHISGIIRVCLQDIKSELIVVKNRGGSEMEGSNCLEESNPQIKFQSESYKENNGFSTSVKKECESEDDSRVVHEDATVDHVNDVKEEDVHQTLIGDYSEGYTEFNKIEIVEHKLEEVKEEPMSDTETPQDGSTIQPDIGISEEPKGSEETTIGTEITPNTLKDNEGIHQCEICKKNFQCRSHLTEHIKSHSNEKPHGCKICKKGFQQKSKLSKHIKSHSSERPYECDICKKGFKQKDHLTIHIKSHSNERPYECEICKKDFLYKSNLTKHIQSHSSEKPYECDICKKGFKHKTYLTAHMKSHSSEKPYECNICKKRFHHKNSISKHIISHSSERPHECEICKKDFQHKSNLNKHMKLHSSERPYECQICNRSFKHKDRLIEHMKSHSNERPYECDICKRGFKHKSNLTGHMKTHSSESHI